MLDRDYSDSLDALIESLRASSKPVISFDPPKLLPTFFDIKASISSRPVEPGTFEFPVAHLSPPSFQDCVFFWDCTDPFSAVGAFPVRPPVSDAMVTVGPPELGFVERQTEFRERLHAINKLTEGAGLIPSSTPSNLGGLADDPSWPKKFPTFPDAEELSRVQERFENTVRKALQLPPSTLCQKKAIGFLECPCNSCMDRRESTSQEEIDDHIHYMGSLNDRIREVPPAPVVKKPSLFDRPAEGNFCDPRLNIDPLRRWETGR